MDYEHLQVFNFAKYWNIDTLAPDADSMVGAEGGQRMS